MSRDTLRLLLLFGLPASAIAAGWAVTFATPPRRADIEPEAILGLTLGLGILASTAGPFLPRCSPIESLSGD